MTSTESDIMKVIATKMWQPEKVAGRGSVMLQAAKKKPSILWRDPQKIKDKKRGHSPCQKSRGANAHVLQGAVYRQRQYFFGWPGQKQRNWISCV